MLSSFLLVFLLVYFWYFYHVRLPPLPPPPPGSPEPATPFDLTLRRLGEDTFQVLENGQWVWDQTLPSYVVSDTPEGLRIEETDACFHTVQDKIPAKGLDLYHFVKQHPEFQSLVDPHPLQRDRFISKHGTPFYFTCQGKRIVRLTLCPPGRIFEQGDCQPISSCTGQPDTTRLPHPDPHYWIQCQGGEEHVRQCAPGEVFYAGTCTSQADRLCLLQKHLPLFKLDDHTLFGCQNHQPVYQACPPGTRLFESTVCEPSDCYGRADGTKIPWRKRKLPPFEYSSGYWECHQGKRARTEECPSVWDPMLAKEENLTRLPMVFDPPSQTCALPSLCDNVWPTEPDILVPAYDYTRRLQNWSHAPYYDQGRGYRCDGNGRKEEVYVEVEKRINDHFKIVPLCRETDTLVPLGGRLRSFWDCQQNRFRTCDDVDQFFNGKRCVPTPTDREDGPVFKYNSYIPLFQFDSLSADGWIQPFVKISEPDHLCERGYELIKPYNICSEPPCAPMAFLSMIPELSLLLPPETGKAKCQYDEATKHLRRLPLPATLHYSFWDQKIRHAKERIPTDHGRERCTFGQHTQTGNFIWDRTLYATCDPNQPFVFCPSVDTRQIYPVTYACAPPPDDKKYHHDKNLNDYTSFPKNQFMRVWRGNPNVTTSVILNRSDTYKHWRDLPPEGLEIPDDERVNLRVLHPVDLEYKWRMTFPPQVVYKYTTVQGRTTRETVVAENPSQVFNLNSQQFEPGKFVFPRYRVRSFVDQFNSRYDP